ncbi:MAG: aldehyde dehydrogenase family protein [Lachnospiraceae bacterium]|nr:aldehyde dehydrogenase family protein [Clostridiales bacterium]MCC8141161.1 aldehyde dehydrogenase family protein [Lachnospiraceae bacterium]
MANLKESYGIYVDGQWRPASDGATFTATNPATGESLAKCANATKEDVDAAVQAGWKAFPAWKATSKEERVDILNKIADRMEENLEWLAKVESMDNGKPIRETMAIDLPYSIRHFRYYASLLKTDNGVATILEGRFMSLVLREPIGVVGQIVPWNFPILMAAWKMAPAIAAGDCIVFKPSSETSLSVLEFTDLIGDLLPAGVLNLVTGSGSGTGQYLLDHPDLSKLAFTGSTEVGKNIALAAADKLIPATLELGGKSANIIFDDCDIDSAVDGIQLGILFNQGQVCCAGSRIFVQEGIYDEFLEKAVAAFNKINIGDPMDMNTQMSCQINETQGNKILSYIDIAKKDGATIACGGERYTENGCDKGFFIRPTLITGLQNTDCCAQEEIFGPVAVVMKFKTEDEVVAMANDSVYGLGGAVWTTNINRGLRVASAIETGRVWVNTYNQIPEGAPFGGYKQSGIGRECDEEILDAYSQKKNIMINLEEGTSGFYPQ